VQDELVLADMIILEKRLERLQKQRRVKLPAPEEKMELDILERALQHLSAGHPLRTLVLDPVEKKMLRGFQFSPKSPSSP